MPPSRKCSKRPWSGRRHDSWATVCSRTIGIWSCGPREDGELSRFTGWLTLTHTHRWHAHRHSAGTGHVYQGRFKSFPVQEDDHFTRCAGTSNGMRCGRISCGARRTGGGAAYIGGSSVPRRRMPCWRLGPCRAGRVGWNTSTRSRRKRNWPPCAAVYNAAIRWATHPGATKWFLAWAWKARFARKAARKDATTVPDTFSAPHLFCARGHRPCYVRYPRSRSRASAQSASSLASGGFGSMR